jgi:hypothetical protein
MNPDRFQSNKSEPVFTATVSGIGDTRITVRNVAGDPVGDRPDALFVQLDQGDDSLTLFPNEAGRLAEVLIRASCAAGDPTAKRVLGILEEYVAQRTQAEASDDDLRDDEDDISPEDRLMAAAGMEKLVADMRAAGAATVGEYFAMQQEAANKANADGPR